MESNQYFLINPNLSLKEVKEVFHSKFPNLYLDFFLKDEEIKLEQLSLPIKEVSDLESQKAIVITSEMKVSDVIEEFLHKMGLKIRIFRKLGNSNVETSYTSQWSLKLQNQRGGEMFF